MIIGIDGTNWISALWHTVGDRAPILAAERLSAVVDHALSLSSTPIRVVVCWDRRSFRHDLHPEYKAGRPEKDAGWVRAIAEAPKHLGVDGISLAVAGYEADDLLASLAAAAVACGEQCILCSGDKDVYQCLRAGKVTVLRNFRTDRVVVDGTTYIRLYEPQWVREADLMTATGLRADQWIDYQCLVGQNGDNVPGCNGWGKTHVPPLLQAAGDLPAAFALLDRGNARYNPYRLPGVKRKGNAPVLPARYKTLVDWQPRYKWTRRLIELRTDVEAVVDALR